MSKPYPAENLLWQRCLWHEGFGSLDDASRDQAIRVLNDLADKDRLVGIISHVNELKEQIDHKLVVKKTDKGSSVSWSV